ncbi:MAG: hypothetical protein VB858_02650, partial [Planctomycetaceae bacterium]
EVTLGTLQATPFGNLVMSSAMGTATTTLPIVASIGGANLNTTVVVSDADIFDTSGPQFQVDGGMSGSELVLPGGLDAFNSTSSASLNGVLLDLREFLNASQASPLLDAVLPFTAGAKLGEVFDFGDAFDTAVTSLLEVNSGMPNAPNIAAYATAQELQQLVPAITGVTYTESDMNFGGNPVLRYTIDASKVFTPLMGTIDLSLLGDNASELAAFETSSPLGLTRDVTLQLTVGLELVQPGASSTITAATPLATVLDADRWNTLRVDPPNLSSDVTVTLRDGTTFGVLLNDIDATDTNNTLSTIVSRINAAAVAALPGITGAATFTTFNSTPGVTRFEFHDPTTASGPDPKSRITLSNGSLIGFLAGLLGKDDDNDGVFVGGALHGDSVAKHVFLENPTLTGQSTLQAPDIDATANFGGLIGLNITDGSGSITADATLTFNDPTPGGLTIADLVSEMNDLGDGSNLITVTPNASASLTLPTSVGTDLSSLTGQSLTLPGTSIAASWPTVFEINPTTKDVLVDVDALDVTLHNFDALTDFSNLDGADVEALLGAVANFVDQLGGFDFFQTEIPLINRSLSDLIGFDGSFRSTVAAFSADSVSTLDGLETVLINALGSEFSSLDVSLDLAGDVPVLRIDLPYDVASYSETLPLDFDLNQLGVP